MSLNLLAQGRAVRLHPCSKVFHVLARVPLWENTTQYLFVFLNTREHMTSHQSRRSVYIKGKTPPGAGCEKWGEVSSPKGEAEDVQRGAEQSRQLWGIPLASAAKSENGKNRFMSSRAVNTSTAAASGTKFNDTIFFFLKRQSTRPAWEGEWDKNSRVRVFFFS